MKFNKTIGNLIVLGVGLFLGMLVGEMAIRIFAPQKLVKPCYLSDPELALAGIPNCTFVDNWHKEYFTYEVRFNNLGYRMDKDVTQAHDNMVACLGDSYTYGWGVDFKDAFWSILNEELKNKSAPVELVNAGFPSYSTGHVTKTLERLDDQFPVRKAIYFMFFNDVFDNVRADKNYLSHTFDINTEGVVELSSVSRNKMDGKPSRAKKTREWLYKRSHLVMLLRKSMPDFKNGHSHSGPRTEDKVSEEQIETMIKVTMAHLENLNQKCHQRGIDLQIVWIPCWDALDLENDYDWKNYFPFQKLKTQMAVSYNFYNPTDHINGLLEGKNEKISDYYFGEGHYNEKGNRLFYEAIKEEIFGFIAPESSETISPQISTNSITNDL